MPDVVGQARRRRGRPARPAGVLRQRHGADATGMWAPDTLKAAGYSDVLRQPGIEAMALPELTGNVYDFSADAQQHIAVKPRGARSRRRATWSASGRRPGFAAVAPVGGARSARARRAARRAPARGSARAGEALLPLGDGPPCPSPRVAGAVPRRPGRGRAVARRPGRAPAALPAARRAKRAPTPFTVNRPLSPSRFSQRNVSLAASRPPRVGGLRGAARRPRARSCWCARATAVGRGARRSRRPGRASGRDWWPSVAAGPGGRVWVAWQDDSSGVPRVYVAVSRDARPELRSGARDRRHPAADAAQWRPSIAATGRRSAVVAWIDERERSRRRRPAPGPRPRGSPATADGARPRSGSRAWTPARPSSWRPSSTTPGRPTSRPAGARVAVAWIDFHTYDWRPYLRASPDGGATWGARAPALRRAAAGARERGGVARRRAAASRWAPAARASRSSTSASAPRRRAGRTRSTTSTSNEPGGASGQVDPWGARQLEHLRPRRRARARRRPAGGLAGREPRHQRHPRAPSGRGRPRARAHRARRRPRRRRARTPGAPTLATWSRAAACSPRGRTSATGPRRSSTRPRGPARSAERRLRPRLLRFAAFAHERRPSSK